MLLKSITSYEGKFALFDPKNYAVLLIIMVLYNPAPLPIDLSPPPIVALLYIIVQFSHRTAESD